MSVAARKPVHAKHRPGIRKAQMPMEPRVPEGFPSELRLKNDEDLRVTPHKQVIENQLEQIRLEKVEFSRDTIKMLLEKFVRKCDPTIEERQAMLTMVTQTILDVRPGPTLTREQEAVFQRRHRTA